ncbi:MAG: FAD synthase, partial [Methanobrevibacter sp.]|nr:FAD synthase [Methanobrevibacter sp.]
DAYLGDANGDVFKIVREIDPDIITVGADQNHDIGKLQAALDKRGLKAKAVRIEKYRDCELDSSCKIIRKIQNTDFEGKIMDHCDD